MTGMRIKICGVTRPEDARAAEIAGADAIGLNFAKKSKRYITLEQAQAIAQAVGPFISKVGVFVDADPAFIRETARVLKLSAVQLHGQESPDDADALRNDFTVIKAISFTPDLTLDTLNAYPADAILLDGLKPGSGEAFDWQAAAFLQNYPRLILAGGLTPDNVSDAIRALKPYAVDLSSGVESQPGIKDPNKMRAFIQNARNA